MKVIGIPLLDRFAAKHADVRSILGAWLEEVKFADWKTPSDIKDKYKATSFLANNIVVFNIKRNDYRLVAKIAYNTGIVKIERLGTHAEYSKWKL
ncbi:MAG: type II toxin-antitoxin system HigB family toxin [Pyrinomonadaceae bacterium]|nr:type II toxin-antitoxin system HigB family toxin [Pyrinomonadaceae bacterium]MBP6212716.1 type II toxin-antitoxin system HigB family toxin [Pyrinomonadaceae bacterium]